MAVLCFVSVESFAFLAARVVGLCWPVVNTHNALPNAPSRVVETGGRSRADYDTHVTCATSNDKQNYCVPISPATRLLALVLLALVCFLQA